VTGFCVDWEALSAMDPADRARAAIGLLEEVPGVQSRLKGVRSAALAEMRDRCGSNAAVARELGISPARVGQLIDGGTRPDGIKLGLIRRGLLLAIEYGSLQPGDDRKVQQAMEALSRPGHLTETEARGVATRLGTIRVAGIDTARMTDDERGTWRRAVAHAYEVCRNEHHRPAQDG
jgi:hypothetical protein